MIIIDDNNNITMTRGDSALIQIGMVRNGEPITPVEGEVVRFAVKAKYKDPDENVLIYKEIPLDTLLLEIFPEDTKQLVMGKTYVYDVQYTDINGRVDTFIIGELTIGEEVM